MAVVEQAPEVTPEEARALRLAATRARVAAILQDPGMAASAARAMDVGEGVEEAPADQVTESAYAGEFAEAAFVEAYGCDFVDGLKSRYGG